MDIDWKWSRKCHGSRTGNSIISNMSRHAVTRRNVLRNDREMAREHLREGPWPGSVHGGELDLVRRVGGQGPALAGERRAAVAAVSGRGVGQGDRDPARRPDAERH